MSSNPPQPRLQATSHCTLFLLFLLAHKASAAGGGGTNYNDLSPWEKARANKRVALVFGTLGAVLLLIGALFYLRHLYIKRRTQRSKSSDDCEVPLREKPFNARNICPECGELEGMQASFGYRWKHGEGCGTGCGYCGGMRLEGEAGIVHAHWCGRKWDTGEA